MIPDLTQQFPLGTYLEHRKISTCDKRQVPNCNMALAHGNGGVLSSQCTVILGSAATL